MSSITFVWQKYPASSARQKYMPIFWFFQEKPSGSFGPWASGQWMHGPFMHGPFTPFFVPALLRFAWVFLVLRAGLALVAAWGLMERAPWGRIVAIVAACLSLIRFPFGTALGIWTLIVLLGDRNSTLYEQL